MYYFLCSVVFLIACAHMGSGKAPYEILCLGQPDGLLEFGCWGYANCYNETPDIHECPEDTVFDRDTFSCIEPGEGNNDCYLRTECKGMEDGFYADYGDDCITYFRCHGEVNLGRFYCPANLGFNEYLEICDYRQYLPPPCGNYIYTDPPTDVTTEPTTPKSTATTTVFHIVAGPDAKPAAAPAEPDVEK